MHECVAWGVHPHDVYEAFHSVTDFTEFTFHPLSSIASKATTVAKLLCASPVLVGVLITLATD